MYTFTKCSKWAINKYIKSTLYSMQKVLLSILFAIDKSCILLDSWKVIPTSEFCARANFTITENKSQAELYTQNIGRSCIFNGECFHIQHSNLVDSNILAHFQYSHLCNVTKHSYCTF